MNETTKRKPTAGEAEIITTVLDTINGMQVYMLVDPLGPNLKERLAEEYNKAVFDIEEEVVEKLRALGFDIVSKDELPEDDPKSET